MLTDTHAHLYLEEFDEDRDEMLQRAKDAGISRFYLPNIDSGSIQAMLALEEKYPGSCFPMMGLHPCSVKENYLEELAIVKTWIDRRSFCAIGEIGIDLYWDDTFIDFQKEAFITQIRWAKEKELPIVIHSRNSIDLIIEIIRQEKDERLRGIFHCFTGTASQANEIIELGFHLGIGGVLTFKKSGLDETIKDIPLENIVLETDSPYLAPTPYRGKRNESAFIRIIAERLAAIKSVSLDKVAAMTTTNAQNIFHKNSEAYTTLS